MRKSRIDSKLKPRIVSVGFASKTEQKIQVGSRKMHQLTISEF